MKIPPTATVLPSFGSSLHNKIPGDLSGNLVGWKCRALRADHTMERKQTRAELLF